MPFLEQTEPLILASASPRRQMLLSNLGLAFQIIASDHPETLLLSETPVQFAERLALEKAGMIADEHRNAWVIGADTSVVLDDRIYGKPKDREEAFDMLSKLLGRTHEVCGGFSILHRERGVSYSEVHSTEVKMLSLEKEEINAYIDTGEPLDKAGAYGIQGIGAALVCSVKGSYTNVMGLNAAAVFVALKRLGAVK